LLDSLLQEKKDPIVTKMKVLIFIFMVSFCFATSMSPERANANINKTVDPRFTNSAAPSDTYAMFKQLMNVREDMEREDEKQEPRMVTTLKNAFQSLLEVAFKGFFEGFLPHVQRQRRDTTDGDARSYMDIAIGAVGALMGRQGCSEKIACRTGKFVGQRVPGASLAVMMIEGIVPKSLMNWFGVVKTAVIDRSDNCDEEYECLLVDDEAQS